MSVPSCFLLNMDKCPVFHLTSKASPEVKAERRSKCAVLVGLKGILEKILVDTSTGEWLLIVFWFPRKTLQSVLSKIMNKTIILKNVGSSFGLNQKDTITTWMYNILSWLWRHETHAAMRKSLMPKSQHSQSMVARIKLITRIWWKIKIKLVDHNNLVKSANFAWCVLIPISHTYITWNEGTRKWRRQNCKSLAFWYLL